MAVSFLVEEIGVPEEIHRPDASNWQTLSHNVVSSTPRISGIQTHNFSGDNHKYILEIFGNFVWYRKIDFLKLIIEFKNTEKNMKYTFQTKQSSNVVSPIVLK